MVDIKQRIGQQIREARKAKGMTQRDLASKLGVAETTVTNYEAGRQNLTLETLSKIAEALQVDFNIAGK